MPDAAPSPAPKRKPWIPLLVLVSFVAPIVIAYWFAILHPEAVPRKLVNRGTLLEPPVALVEGPARADFEAMARQPDEWSLLYFTAGPCDARCAAQLDLAGTIRALIGAQGKRVHLLALLDEAPAAVPPLVKVMNQPTARAALASELGRRLGAPPMAGYVFLDARHLAMMFFSTDAPPGDIKEDLKRLLRASSVR